MLNVSSTTFSGAGDIAQPIRRVTLNAALFRIVFIAEALLIAVALLAVVRVLPRAGALVANADYDRVRTAVYQRTNGDVVDPLIEIAPGMRGPASSVRGFALHGSTYYYYLAGRDNFDPLSRGQVRENQINVVLQDNVGEAALVIYTIPR